LFIVRYTDDLPIQDAIHRAIRVLKTGFQGEMTENNIEIGMITSDKKFVTFSHQKIKDYLLEASQ
jgi:20S proteasome subunit alpha 2